MKKVLILSSFVVLLFFSCKKDEIEVVDNSGTYTFQKVEIGSIKLYSKSGEIKDLKTIIMFLNVHDSSNLWFIQKLDSNITLGTVPKITIKQNNQVKLSSEWGDTATYIIKDYNGIQCFESIDTTSYYFQGGSSYVTSKQTSMFLYKPIYSETIYFPGAHQIKTKSCKYLFLSKNKIAYPILTYFYFWSTPQNERHGYNCVSGLNNVFNEEYIKVLNSTDTIAVQQRNYIFMKQ